MAIFKKNVLAATDTLDIKLNKLLDIIIK